MQAELTLALVIIAVGGTLLAILRIIFRRSIVFTIATTFLITTAMIAYITFIIGLRGMVHLFWGVPLGVIAFLASILILKRQVFDPVLKVEKKLESVSQGDADLSERLAVVANNEIGELARHYNSFVEKLKGIIVRLVEMNEKSRQLGTELAANASETVSTTEEIRATIGSLEKKSDMLASEIDEAARTTASISEFNRALDALIEEQAAAISESSASIDEMISALAAIERTTGAKKVASDRLADMAAKGEEGMRETVNGIMEISRSTEAIAELISVIRNVAAQTSLLGMNAAIEAAHAGDAGRGFNIVAEEIRKLAETTSKSSESIAKSLEGMIAGIGATTEVTKGSEKLIAQIIDGIKDISASMTETINGIRELNTGSKQVTESLAGLITISENVKSSSVKLVAGTEGIETSMQTIRDISIENKRGMSEIVNGMNEISKAAVSLADMSAENTANIHMLETEIGRFRVAEIAG